MKTFGKAVRERRKALGLTQRQLAARVRFEDGHALSEPYLNAIEHDLCRPPREHIIAQFAHALGTNPDVFFYLAGRMPPDLREFELTNEELQAAFEAFRRVLAEGREDTAHKRAQQELLRPVGITRAI